MASLASLLKMSAFLLALLSSTSATGVNASIGGQGCYFDSIYCFGDSMSDTGNLIREGIADGAFAPISKFPYGAARFDKPSGRCSNGFLMIDYFALDLKLPLLPPYLDEDADFTHGANFAVAGATAMDPSFFAANGIMPPFTNSSLDVQLGWFKKHINATCPFTSTDKDCKKRFWRSLFFLGEIGGNDYNYALLTGKPIDQVKEYVPDVVAKIKKAADEVLDAGAVYLIVPGNFPIGCFPSYLARFQTNDTNAYGRHGCLKGLNSFAEYHNGRIKKMLKELRKERPHATNLYADYYKAFMFLINKGRFLGFQQESLLKACCGGGGGAYNYDMAMMCGSPRSSTCPDPSRLISWDGVHLTQEAFRIMTKVLTIGGLMTPIHHQWAERMCLRKWH